VAQLPETLAEIVLLEVFLQLRNRLLAMDHFGELVFLVLREVLQFTGAALAAARFAMTRPELMAAARAVFLFVTAMAALGLLASLEMPLLVRALFLAAEGALLQAAAGR
jgi:hypothetical protein